MFRKSFFPIFLFISFVWFSSAQLYAQDETFYLIIKGRFSHENFTRTYETKHGVEGVPPSNTKKYHSYVKQFEQHFPPNFASVKQPA